MHQASPYPRNVYGLKNDTIQARTMTAFKEAVAAYSAYHKKKYGYETSVGDIMMTATLQHNDFIKREFEKRIKEKEEYLSDKQRKYIDGIKAPRSRTYVH